MTKLPQRIFKACFQPKLSKTSVLAKRISPHLHPPSLSPRPPLCFRFGRSNGLHPLFLLPETRGENSFQGLASVRIPLSRLRPGSASTFDLGSAFASCLGPAFAFLPHAAPCVKSVRGTLPTSDGFFLFPVSGSPSGRRAQSFLFGAHL